MNKSLTNILHIVLSLVVAVVLWLYVVTVENPEQTTTIYNIPVSYTGLETLTDNENLLMTSGNDATVTLRLTGKRSEISQLTNSNITVTADVSQITRATTYNLSYSIEFPSTVSSSAIEIDGQSPSRIQVTIEKAASKEIEVRGVLNGSAADGYTAKSMTFDHDTVVISGPADLIANVKYALVTLERTNLEKTVTAELPIALMDEENNEVVSDEITCDTDIIEVTQPIAKFKEISLTVDFIDGGGATEENIIYEISPKTITVSGDAEYLELVNQINLGNIDLGEILSSESFEFPVLLPNNVESVSGETTAIVTVEIKGLATKTVRVSDIEFVQIPAGFTAESVTKTIQVMIRADEADISAITATNIHAVADLSYVNASVGSYTVPLTVEIYGYPNAGVYGSYTALIALAEEETEPEETETGDET